MKPLRALIAITFASLLAACSSTPTDLTENDPLGAGFDPLAARSAFQMAANNLGLRCPTAASRLGTIRARSVAETPGSAEWVGLDTELRRLDDACRNGRQF